MTKHERFVQLLTEANQSPVSRTKDDETPRVETTDAWLKNLRARYAAQPPQPFAAVTERKYATLAEGADAPVPPAEAYTKLRRALRS